MIEEGNSIWSEWFPESASIPSVSYILAENGDYITDENGNRLIVE